MPRITKALKVALILLAMAFLFAGVLWYPYRSGDVPEWKIQIVDTDGRPVAGIRANQEWLDPIEDGKRWWIHNKRMRKDSLCSPDGHSTTA
jgi:hypothetical protein